MDVAQRPFRAVLKFILCRNSGACPTTFGVPVSIRCVELRRNSGHSSRLVQHQHRNAEQGHTRHHIQTVMSMLQANSFLIKKFLDGELVHERTNHMGISQPVFADNLPEHEQEFISIVLASVDNSVSNAQDNATQLRPQSILNQM